MSPLHHEVLAALRAAAKAYGDASPFWATYVVRGLVHRRHVRYPSFRATARTLGDLRRRGLVRHPLIAGGPRPGHWSVAS